MLVRPCIGAPFVEEVTLLKVDESKNLIVADWKQYGAIIEDGKLVTEWDTEFDLNGIEWEMGKTSYCYLFPLDGTEKLPVTEFPELSSWCHRLDDFWRENPDYFLKRNSTMREPEYQI